MRQTGNGILNYLICPAGAYLIKHRQQNHARDTISAVKINDNWERGEAAPRALAGTRGTSLAADHGDRAGQPVQQGGRGRRRWPEGEGGEK